LPESTRRNADRAQRILVEIEVETNSTGEALAVLRAIKPDNRTAPPWLRIREELDGPRIRISVEALAKDPHRLGSVKNTVDEILEFLYSLLKSIEETAKTLKQATRERGMGVGL